MNSVPGAPFPLMPAESPSLQLAALVAVTGECDP